MQLPLLHVPSLLLGYLLPHLLPVLFPPPNFLTNNLQQWNENNAQLRERQQLLQQQQQNFYSSQTNAPASPQSSEHQVAGSGLKTSTPQSGYNYSALALEMIALLILVAYSGIAKHCGERNYKKGGERVEEEGGALAWG